MMLIFSSMMLIFPVYQGRLMNSSCKGDSGYSFDRINYLLITSKKLEDHINAYGGEERLRLAIEIGKFSFFFKKTFNQKTILKKLYMLNYKMIPWLMIILLFSILMKSYGQIKGTLWDVQDIYKVPKYKIISSDSVVGIIYDGLAYKKHSQNVFAYYSSPGIISGDRSKDKNLPAVVLVHGGGGAAFSQWVALWARRGYLAIAMDWRGNGPDGKHIENGFEEVDGQTPIYRITPNLEDQWMYQAVANVILAHNLVRSFSEVDTNRTALIGISWGGVITCTVAGLDERFQVAVPVYGCGFFPTSVSLAHGLDALNIKDRATWLRQYDPLHYVGNAKMPMLFVDGPNDPAFYLDSYARTYKLVKNKVLSIEMGLLHGHYGHGSGWEIKEPYYFIDSYLKNTKPLCKIGNPKIKGREIRYPLQSYVSVKKAYLNYTTDTASMLMNRKWNSIEIPFTKNRIISSLPPLGTTIWYNSIIDERGLITSGEVQFKDEKIKSLVNYR